jgi:pimeloyl-ACP methyl ester carboxylesterase
MSSNSNPRRTVTKPQGPNFHPPNSQYTGQFELVDPRFLLKALAGVIIVSLILAYITLCVIFSHSQWQLFLQPSRSVTKTPMSADLPFSEVHFGVDATGEPQLDGWWIPSSNPAGPTILFLHGGTGSISDTIDSAIPLRDAHLNVLLFDYRGFGRSGGQHPTQALMQADAESYLIYLTTTRSIPLSQIVVYGTGLGGSVATKLCAEHPQLPALILDNPDGDLGPRAAHDTRARLVLTSLLFHEDFPLAAPLHQLTTPKLLITDSKQLTPPAVLQQAADPKMTVELPNADPALLQKTVTRFLGSYVQQAPGILIPKN